LLTASARLVVRWERNTLGRSAFVCNSDAACNAMRILMAYAEANDYRVELAVVRDIDEPQDWLSSGPTKTPREQARRLA
jgi:hypothetical protein